MSYNINKSFLYKIENYLFDNQKPGIQDSRRLLCFLMLTAIELIVIPSYLYGRGWRTGIPFLTLTTVQTIIFIAAEAGVWTKKIRVKNALRVLLATIYARLAFEILFYIIMGNFTLSMVIGNFVMCMAATIFSLVSRLRIQPLVMSICTMAFFILGVIISRNDLLADTFWYFGIAFTATLLLTIFNYRQIGHDMNWAVQVNTMTAEELKTLNLLSNRPDLDVTKTASLIERLSDERKEHIINNVTNYIRKDDLRADSLEKLCPELTASEIEICQLIMQGKSLKEICAELGKNESNISSQRSHIRQKFGMDRKDNIKRYLEKHVKI